MSRLGDFLEVVFGAPERFNSIVASIRHWTDPRFEQESKPKASQFGRRKPVDPSVETKETTLAIWMVALDKVRVAESRRKGASVSTSLEIVNGDRNWRIDDEGHVEVGTEKRRHSGGVPDVDRHFNRGLLRQFCVGLDLELLGDVRAVGQDCIRIRANPRP